MASDAESLEAALAQAGLGAVSHETQGRLIQFVDLLRHWQRVKNLVAPGTLDDVWARHIGDCAQLVSLAPKALRWLDLGSGAGFPGIVTAILLSGRADGSVVLVESNTRKASFLREAARLTGAPAEVRSERIEDIVAAAPSVEAISARALAPLDQLAVWLEPLMARGAIAYLHKGEDFEREYQAATLGWSLDLLQHPSRFGPGVIVELRGVRRRSKEGKP